MNRIYTPTLVATKNADEFSPVTAGKVIFCRHQGGGNRRVGDIEFDDSQVDRRKAAQDRRLSRL